MVTQLGDWRGRHQRKTADVHDFQSGSVFDDARTGAPPEIDELVGRPLTNLPRTVKLVTANTVHSDGRRLSSRVFTDGSRPRRRSVTWRDLRRDDEAVHEPWRP